MNFRLDLAIAFAISFLGLVNGHGSLIEPPSRASMWRYGYKTPANFNDNQLFCGGFWVRINLIFCLEIYFRNILFRKYNLICI